jgi:2-polyprenyl-6-methoxyphenol hydroxylase-like FAD-dependent oxidoreductase
VRQAVEVNRKGFIMKAIIIGAGIGGLATALTLQKQGIEAVIYERAAEVRADGAGLSIWANALRVLDYLGIYEELAARSAILGKGGIYTAKGDILSQAENDSSSIATTLALVVHRSDLHEALLSQLKSPLCTGHEFSHYKQMGGAVQVFFKDGSSDTADILIAADGLYSGVRLQMQPKSLPVYSGYGAWRGVVTFDYSKIGDFWGESWGQGQRFGIAPIGKNRIYWFATNNLPAEKRFTGAESKAHLLREFANWFDPIPELIAATSAEAILYHPISDIEPLERWVDGRVALLGDAAHAMTPNMGQGACQAIEDAYALGHALGGVLSLRAADKNNRSVKMALAQYESLRLPRASIIMSRSRQIGKVGQLTNPLLCFLRDTAIKLLPSSTRDEALNAVIHYDILKAL